MQNIKRSGSIMIFPEQNISRQTNTLTMIISNEIPKVAASEQGTGQTECLHSGLWTAITTENFEHKILERIAIEGDSPVCEGVF